MKPIIFIIGIIKLQYMQTIFKQIISIILLSIVFALFKNYFIQNNNVSLIKHKKTTGKIVNGVFDIPDFMIEPQIVSSDFVKYYFQNSKVTIIDARDEEEYNQSHIEGSINIPYNYYEDYDVLYDLPIENIYIVYCNGEECSLSLDLAYVMYDEFDFETVFVYEEGLPIWEELGYSVKMQTLGDKNKVIKDTILTKSNFSNIITENLWILLFLLVYFIFAIKTVLDNTKSVYSRFKTIMVVSFRLILGIVFISASIQKIINPSEFSNQIDLYKATPIILNNIIALIIPWMEFFIGLCLIFNRNIKGSIILSALLFIIFIVLLSQAYYRGISLDCGCFGGEISKTSVEQSADMLKRIRQDIIYLGMSIYLYFIYVIDKRKYAN